MRRLIHPISIMMIILMMIISLPFILPDRKSVEYSDKVLREKALPTKTATIPQSYDELLKMVNNPQNPLTPQKIALGKELFNEKLLSKDRDISCATCHILDKGGDDNLPTAIGHRGLANPSHLNSPTVLNATLAKSQFWDGRAKDVEEQAGGPIQAPFEMNMRPSDVEDRLNSKQSYIDKFREVFGVEKISFQNVRDAIGTYERTLLTRGAYDRFLDGDDNALSPQAKRGLTLFITKGCKVCHSGISVGGETTQKFPLRRYLSDYIGAIFDPTIKIKESPFPFENVGGFLGQFDRLKFRVPILRNISKTAPYFHNGSVDKLEEVVRIMSKYQLGDEFTPNQIDDVVAFLKSLDGELVEYNITK